MTYAFAFAPTFLKGFGLETRHDSGMVFIANYVGYNVNRRDAACWTIHVSNT